jgi:1-acyl-sn-glycerol-3-phosphate acyltransferase
MLLYRLVILVGSPIAWILFRPRVRGRENLGSKGGLVICPNHLSGFDVFAVGYAAAPRRLRNMGKIQLFRRPVLGRVARSLGGFPARAENGLPGGVEAAAALAARGEAVVIFPEGARRRGRIRRPRTGAALVALAAEVPIVPVALSGTDGWRQRLHWQIAFGAPVPLDDLRAQEPGRVAREATRRMWESVLALEAELAR